MNKDWILPVVMLSVMLVILGYGTWFLYNMSDEMLEHFINKDISECDRIYEEPENWNPIDGTLDEKMEYCKNWYAGGMQEQSIKTAENGKIMAVYGIPIISVLIFVAIYVMLRPERKRPDEES